MCKNEVESSPGFGQQSDEAPEETDQPVAELERVLLEEVDFWKSYIGYCRDKGGASVPVEAYEALAQSEHKLQTYRSGNTMHRKLFARIH